MNIYETLLHLATEPYEQNIKLRDEIKSSEAVLNELKKEFSIKDQFILDTRQACETMVYKD